MAARQCSSVMVQHVLCLPPCTLPQYPSGPALMEARRQRPKHCSARRPLVAKGDTKPRKEGQIIRQKRQTKGREGPRANVLKCLTSELQIRLQKMERRKPRVCSLWSRRERSQVRVFIMSVSGPCLPTCTIQGSIYQLFCEWEFLIALETFF